MKRRLDDVQSSRNVRKVPSLPRMRFTEFRDCVIFQRLAELYDFSKEDKEIVHKKCYANHTIVSRQLEQFKKYLRDMEKRTSQRIPKEQLREYFGGKHDKDVILPGIFSHNLPKTSESL